MDITCVSDLHGNFPDVSDGDLLIIAGDCTARDDEKSWKKFMEWAEILLEYDKIILVGGNHDNALQKGIVDLTPAIDDYLCDSGIEYEGLKIWGSPWTKTFSGMNPNCKAFTVDTDEELAEKWAKIPEDTDILITHCPPFTYFDLTQEGKSVGSLSLAASTGRLNLKLHVFGHIHECGGKISDGRLIPKDLPGFFEVSRTIFVNASHVNERYQPVNKPIRIILEGN
jgi:Icc-related predicted phosphoesterase